MRDAYVAVIAAGLGVLGTLSAPIVTTWLSMKTRRQDFELQQDRESAGRREEIERQALLDRRTCYIGLNTTARRYHGAIRAYSHAAHGTGDRLIQAEERLTEARHDYREKYSEAQMIVSSEVLEHARRINTMLADAYGMLRRIEEGVQLENESLDRVRGTLDGGWEPLREMRSAMRRDLGIGAE